MLKHSIYSEEGYLFNAPYYDNAVVLKQREEQELKGKENIVVIVTSPTSRITDKELGGAVGLHPCLASVLASPSYGNDRQGYGLLSDVLY